MENAVKSRLKPPASTMTLSAGTRTSSKNMSADGTPRNPMRCSRSPKVSPGVSLSTTTAPIPAAPGRSSSRTYTRYCSAWPAPEHQRLTPLMTTSSPSTRPRVVASVAADPASASEMATPSVFSPAAMGGSSRSFCSSVPKRCTTRAGPVEASKTGHPACGAHFESSSSTISASKSGRPPPPYSSGRAMPSSPSSPRRRRSSSGRAARASSHSCARGAYCSRASRPAISRRSVCSSVSSEIVISGSQNVSDRSPDASVPFYASEEVVMSQVIQETAAADVVLEELLDTRFSCRAFLDRRVDRATIGRVLRLAQRSPSWCNVQPWQVIVTEGQATERLRDAATDFAGTAAVQPDVPFPAQYEGVFQQRRRDCAWQLYDSVGIEKGDRAASAGQVAKNFEFFGAPHVAIITTEQALGTYGAIDCGLYL